MKTHKLTKEELNEPFNVTIGRLRTAIKYPGNTSQERMLALLEKISDTAGYEMLKLEEYYNQELEDYPGLIDIFDIMKPLVEEAN